MNLKTLQVPWAGPAIAGALLCTALGGMPGRAAAAPAVPAAPAASVAAVTMAHAQIICAREALAYITAWKNYLNAWNRYQLALPGGTYEEIMDAAILLDQAAAQVGTTGLQLITCLAGYLS